MRPRVMDKPGEDAMWNQVYDPFNSKVLSTIAPALPVVTLLVLIASNKVKAHIAAIIALIVANLVAIFIFTMPAGMSLRATVLGAVTGFFPIGWIVLNVIFLYRLTVEKGVFETLQNTIGGVTTDRRLQLLLIAFSFGAFFEGASGFGTPVAVTGAILIGLGFSPLAASGLSLIANTAPVAYGALGTPIAGLASVTGIDPFLLGAMVGRQLPFFSLIVPFWLIWAFAGWQGHDGHLARDPGHRRVVRDPAIPDLELHQSVDRRYRRIADLDGLPHRCSCKVWQPKEIWTLAGAAHAGRLRRRPMPRAAGRARSRPRAQVWMSLLPWIIVCVILLIWGTNAFKGARQSVGDLELRGSRAAQHDQQGRADRRDADAGRARCSRFTWLSYTGSGMLIAAIISGLADGLLARAAWSRPMAGRSRSAPIRCITISAMLAIGTLTRLSGIDATLGLAFAATGVLYPFFGTLLGWLGRRADRLRHRVEHPVRQPAEDHVRAARPLADPDERRQLVRRRDGQDDRRAVDRRRLDRDQLVRPRGHDPALRVLALDRAGLPGRRPGDAAGLCLHRHDRAVTGR